MSNRSHAELEALAILALQTLRDVVERPDTPPAVRRAAVRAIVEGAEALDSKSRMEDDDF